MHARHDECVSESDRATLSSIRNSASLADSDFSKVLQVLLVVRFAADLTLAT